MSIAKITTPLDNYKLAVKVNEIVDAINNYATDNPYVTDISSNGTTLTITFSSGSTNTISTQDTTYSIATTEANGLMSADMVTQLNTLATNVAELAAKVDEQTTSSEE